MEKRKTICPLDCPDACGMIATLQNGEIVKLEGDPEHPFTKGFLCKKVRTYHHRVQSADRILFPQRRIGKKGEGKFERISWDDAWQMMVDQLTEIKNKHGSEAVLPYSYAGNMGLINLTAGNAFFHKYGASRLMATICSSGAKAGWNLHYGTLPASPPEKALDADLIIAWGINIKVTNIHFMPLVVQARRKGSKFVAIDPYLNSTAQVADQYYPVKPGGDTALALGILKILLESNSVDRSFIEKYSEGFEQIEEYIQNQNLENFANHSGLSSAQIHELAALLTETPKTFMRIGIGLSRNTQGAMSVRAITCLAAALGLFDGRVGGGALLSSFSYAGETDRLNYPSLMEVPTRKINMVQLGHALTQLQPPVKGLFVYSSNPVSVAPDASQVKIGMEREDLFTVVHEQFLTPTARYADLLLPATTSFENHDFYGGYGHFYMARVEPVVSNKGESISNFELFQTLAKKMGFADAPFQQSANERIDSFIESIHGISEEHKKQGVKAGEILCSDLMKSGGDYPSFKGRKFQFAARPKDPTVPRIPCLLPLEEFDDLNLKSRYPLKVITPPMIDLLNSTFGERYQNNNGTMLIHPQDAKVRDIRDGDMAEIYNGRGKNIRKAVISDKTQPGLLVVEGIFWESESSQMTGVNELTSQNTTDLGDGSTFHEARAEVRALK
ncbi:MAG: molybdopterin-dependent oxidoreductase [SAR324 cluster bacterium]|nr:molybdopterin-dependent oxidoreductase [SAR324 cluster bacterium]